MIKRRKKRNPVNKNPFLIENLKKMKSVDVYNSLFNMVIAIISWTNGMYMSKNSIKNSDLDEWLDIKEALDYYKPQENKKIYRSVVALNIEEYGYYCNLEIENSIVQTSNKSLQNWSYSKNFVDKWGSSNYKGHIKIVFQSNTKKLYNNIIFDPKTILLYFAKISKYFPNEFNRLKNDKLTNLYFIFRYLNDAKELLLYSESGDLFVEKMTVYGCKQQ